MLVREAFEDTILQIPNSHGMEGNMTVPIAKGTQVAISICSLLLDIPKSLFTGAY